ncbi:MAG TPA: ABC transporter permease subunit [Actinomycetota bacterium]|nr:ABC transporter permease subunit [Actinomycetota bacterium]
MATEAITTHRMLASVLTKTIHDQRRALVWWTLGLIGTAAMYAAIYPSVRANAETLNRFVKSMPEWLRTSFLSTSQDYTSPAGYLHTELFSWLAPLLLLVYAIGAGARAIAGEEERRTLDILLTTPLSRRRVVTDKFLAMVAGTGVLAAVLWAAIAGLGAPFDLRPDLLKFAAAVASTFLLALAFGSIALAAGCATGRRGLSVGVTSALAALSYLMDALLPSLKSLAWVQRLSPFHYYADHEPITNGLDPLHAVVLLAIAGAAFAVALWSFERRDLAA